MVRIRAVILALGLAGCDDATAGRGEVGVGEVGVEPLRARVAAFRGGVAAVGADAATAPAEEASCRDADFAKLGSGDGQALIGEQGELSRFATVAPVRGARGASEASEASEAPEARGEPGARGPSEGTFAFLTARALAALPLPQSLGDVKSATDAVYRIQDLEKRHPYLVVVRLSKRAAPRVEGDRFHAGSAEGWALVYDVVDRKRLCQGSFAAASGEVVGGREGTPLVEAVQSDFERQVRGALDSTLKRIAPRLTLAP